MIDLLLEAVALKGVARAGWVQRGVDHPESVAAHSWGVAWLTLVLCPPELDRERALSYAILHDLPEVRVGDLTPADPITPSEKHAREQAAMAALCADRPDLRALWEAYAAQADPEARLVRQLDRLDMALQALAYHRQGHPGMDAFVTSAAQAIDDSRLRRLLAEVRHRMQTTREAPRAPLPQEAPLTLFERIIARELPADIVYESDRAIAFRDIQPQGPVHVLIIPRKPIPGIASASDAEEALLGHLLLVARDVARQEGLEASGYRLVINQGKDGGQTVDHLHIHLIGGRPMAWPPG